ncbi:MAG: hypothetical protein KAS30_00245, partial [Candidatus Diapherotrites archaeon]|nr:hypothetical protein [Candidatus Diapherotrites archaeon]
TVAFDAINFEFFDDVQPGELIIINQKTGIERKILVKDEHAHCMFEYVYFARPDSDLNGKSVYRTRQELGKQLAEEWIQRQNSENLNVDIVIAAPDTSRTAALAFAEKIQIPYREGLIKNRYIGRTFIMPTQDEREDAVNLKINTLKHEVENQNIIIVDDSIVRGTTSKKLITKLKKANAKNVHMISTCPKIKYPCIYGIDMPTSDELIANNKTEQEIAENIDADTVIYQSIEGLKKSIGCQTLCTACLDGNYPVKMEATTLEEMSQTRTEEILSTIKKDKIISPTSDKLENEDQYQPLRILVIGNSAREHIITETLKKSKTNPQIYAFMSAMNPGIAKLSQETKIGKLDDLSAIIEFAKQTKPEFAFIGPELPISIGVADELEKIGIPSIGPKKQLGQLETSKAFTRQLLKKYEIVGSPKFEIFESLDSIESK